MTKPDQRPDRMEDEFRTIDELEGSFETLEQLETDAGGRWVDATGTWADASGTWQYGDVG